MTKINITLPINKELFEEICNVSLKHPEKRQKLLDEISHSLWTYTENDYPTPDQANFTTVLQLMASPDYYQPVEQRSLGEWLINEIITALNNRDADINDDQIDDLAWILFESKDNNNLYERNVGIAPTKARKWINDFASELANTNLEPDSCWHPVIDPQAYQINAVIMLTDRLFQAPFLQNVINNDAETPIKERIIKYLTNDVDMDAITNTLFEYY